MPSSKIPSPCYKQEYSIKNLQNVKLDIGFPVNHKKSSVDTKKDAKIPSHVRT
jgi:hypothetical protein